MPDGAAVLLEAIYYSNQNIDAAENALAVEDFTPGNWDRINRIFTRAGTWDPVTLLFTKDPAEYDTITGTWTAVADQIAPFDAVMAFTRRADDGPNNNPLPLFLAAAVGMPEVNINTVAIAAILPVLGNSNACIIALDEDGDPGLHLWGTLELHANDCDIQVNSCDPDQATWIHGDAEIYLGLEGGEEGTGGSIIMCGSYRENGSVIIEGTIEPYEGAQDGDPVSLTPPAVPTCDFGGDSGLPVYRWPVLDADGNVEVLYPGVYCGGIDLGGAGGLVDPFITFCGVVMTADCPGVAEGTATHADSLYIIKDGPLNFPGNAGVVGEGVTFYLKDDGDPYSLIDFRGTTNTMLNLSAPEPTYFAQADSSISLAGVLFWHDCGGTPEDCAGQTHNLRGTSGYGMEGLIYVPESKVYIRGTSDADGGDTDCLVLIANTIQMNGTTGLNVDNTCADYGLDDIFIADLRLRLVH